jgi:hypothetical protein
MNKIINFKLNKITLNKFYKIKLLTCYIKMNNNL